ncbi:hypothetical protein SADUNF_Sadunf15G0068500 [Salix dunnii]|uniref:Pantothenate kinase 2 n=1 Tax=Salix dunnii TaxID=1413687 RepID=A0A835JCY6_9ROSI|nr:hypothetical protein SADUNF_Sadunf15G0068500 [Salix dunnii]
MAGLKEDPGLGIDGITIKEELKIVKPEIYKLRGDQPALETVGAVIKGESLINNRPVIDKVREEGSCGQGERDMVPLTSNSIHRSGSRPQLDLSKAAIEGTFEERDPTILLPNQSDDISHLALDIGGSDQSSAKSGLWFFVSNDVNISLWHDIWGSLIKLVYFSRHQDRPTNDKRKKTVKERFGISNGNRRSYPILGGRLHFVKFETSKINECLDFISSKQLHYGGMDSHSWHSETSPNGNAVIKATGGRAYKFADLFKERLGVSLDKEDEMDCLVAGANFLLKGSRLFLSLFEYNETSVLVTIGMMELLLAIRHEAFTHMEGQKEFVQIDQNDLFPYLLVNIGSGVSMIKVDGDGKFERVSGTNVGGGTYWGLGRLLTKCESFDELLELSQRGDNRTIDMLVGDIYGCMDYNKIGLSASTIASSFGKTISEKKELTDYRPEDISLSLLRMISYNIGQISYLNALRFGLKRIFFGGFFIRGHAYTMDAISFAVHFWSKGEAQAMFLRHEGFLGALGAFLSYGKHGLDDLMVHQLVERFPMGAPYTGGKIHGPPLGDLNEKASAISWMEKFVQKGTEITAPVPMAPPGTTGLGGFEVPSSKGGTLRSDASALNVGVLHIVPTLEVFPLLADPKMYEPNTIDLSDHNELEYWFTVLSEHLSDLVDKAVASEGGTDDAKRRGDAFAHAFSAHLARLMEEPAAYGKLGLANLLELREECLREFQFIDVYRSIKLRENEASLAVLPDLLAELDSMTEASPFFLFLIGITSFNNETRLLTLIEGALAANIFDWGSRACVDLYHKGTIIEIYRMSRNKMQRPWQVDDFDVFKERMLGSGDKKPHPHNRALLFVDNSGADVVLGMLPLARELLRRGTEVVLVANSLPALNDVTAMELPDIVAEAAKHCDILRKAAEAGGLLVDAMINTTDGSKENSSSVPMMVVENGCGSPCIDLRQVSSELAAAAKDADLIILEGMGRALHTNFNARFKCEALKLAMVKNQRLAEKLIKGNIYDCVQIRTNLSGSLTGVDLDDVNCSGFLGSGECKETGHEKEELNDKFRVGGCFHSGVSVTQFGPEKLLSQIKDLALAVSKLGILELTVKKNCLSAFFQSLGHKQLPMNQLWDATPDENGAGDRFIEKGSSMISSGGELQSTEDEVRHQMKSQDLAVIFGGELDVAENCRKFFSNDTASNSRKRKRK